MKTRIFKNSFVIVGVLFFILTSAKAQVIETVSYTPAKAGKYKTIATKSLTTFAGNVEVNNNIIGQGEILNADLSSNSINLSTGATLSSGGDLYLPSVYNSSIDEVAIGPDGKFYTTASSVTINALGAAGVISGNEVDFSKINTKLGNNGRVVINGVEMADPNCQVKWVKMKAFTKNQTTSSTPDDYWFAYCDYNPCQTSPNTYYCNGTCQPCPCNKVNIGTAESVQCATINANYQTGLTLIGKCSAGWNGEYDINSATPANYKCHYTSEDIISGYFNCTIQTITSCPNLGYITGIISTDTFREGYTKTCDVISETAVEGFSGYIPSDDQICLKSTLGQGVAVPYAIEVDEGQAPKNETPVNDYHVPDITALPGSMMKCIANYGSGWSTCTTNIDQNQYKANRNKGIRKMFCGFAGNSIDNAETQISNMLGKRNYSCNGTEYSNFPSTGQKQLYYCSSLYEGFEVSNNAEAMCLDIRTHNSNVGNSFSCFINAPMPDQYQAFRAAACNADNGVIATESVEYCSSTGVCGFNGTNKTCTAQATASRTVVKKKRPWCPLNTSSGVGYHGLNSNNEIGDCEEKTSLSFDALAERRSSDITVYLSQYKDNGSMLTCEFTVNE